MVENERLVKSRKRNMKLYPIYRMVGVDIVFLYAVKMLFLTQVKGIDAGDVIFSVSMYSLFMIVLQIPATLLIKRIGYIKSAFISNVTNIIYIILIMFSTNVWWLVAAEFFSAITFALKDVAEPSLLNASIPKAEVKGKIYSKLEGRGISRYNLFNGITNIISGAIYVINPYLPLICAIMCAALACLISLQFKEVNDIENEEKENENETFKSYISDMKKSIKFIIKSKRLRLLLVYSGIMWGMSCIAGEYRDTILVEIGTSSFAIGLISAILGIAASVASRKQLNFHNKFRNKSLKYIALSSALAIIISGLALVLNLPFDMELLVIVLSFIIVKSDVSMYGVLMTRYLANFSNPEILPKIYSVNAISRNVFRMIIGIAGTFLMKKNGTSNAMLIIGFVFLAIFAVLVKLMEKGVGLKPEQYKKEEIEMNVK